MVSIVSTIRDRGKPARLCRSSESEILEDLYSTNNFSSFAEAEIDRVNRRLMCI